MGERLTNSASSLTQLENEDWGDAPPDATSLVSRVHRLRRVPLDELEADDLRVLLGQGISPELLVPRALALLGEDPLLEAAYYPGDLLAAVRGLPESYWEAHPAHRAEVTRLAENLRA